jgi:SH3-like domain-containing protein
MNRLLLSLWLLGAVLYAANTLTIIGWPSGHKKITDRAENQEAAVKADAKAQTAENTGSGITPSADPAPLSQGSDAQSTGAQLSGTKAAIPPTSAQQPSASGGEQSQQDQSASAASDQPQPQAQAQAQAQPQAQPAPSPQQQQQRIAEWVRVASRGADVRAGPSSSAPRLGTVPPGQVLPVVSWQAGWVEVSNRDGSKTGWIYETLLEPSGAPGVQAPAQNSAANSASVPAPVKQQNQGELVKVSTPTGTMRSGPSEDASVLFVFPNGRVFRLVSRRPGWVEVKDMSSGQTGWIAESSIVPVDSSPGQPQAASAPPQPQRGEGMPQRQEATEGETAAPEGAWVPQGEYLEPPRGMDEGDQAPRHWGHRRHRGLAGVFRRAVGAF